MSFESLNVGDLFEVKLSEKKSCLVLITKKETVTYTGIPSYHVQWFGNPNHDVWKTVWFHEVAEFVEKYKIWKLLK